MDADISTWANFWAEFRLPIIMSLIGAIIGHFRKNGIIQMPIVAIYYEPGPFYENPTSIWEKFCRFVYLPIDFLLYLLGIHVGRERNGLNFDLGFLGDLLVGVGTGILAKAAVEMADIQSQFALVSASLLAGFAGMSYILDMQKTDTTKWADDRRKRIDQEGNKSEQVLPERSNHVREIGSMEETAAAQANE